MFPRSLIANTILCAVTSLALVPQTAQAGPLLDWLFGRAAPPAYPVGGPVPIGLGGYAPYTAGYAPAYRGGTVSGYGSYPGAAYAAPLRAGPQFSAPGYANAAPYTYQQPPRPTSLSYVPNYRTNYYRAPVTYYRPTLAIDPATGQQVTRMTPCTSYELQTQRRPAFGRTPLFGSAQRPAIVAAPVAPRSYTLPSAGIPLTRPQTAFPYTTRSYGGYTTLQPPVAVAPGNYSTAPLGSTPYYGTQSGGCTGGYSAGPGQVPGLYSGPAPQSAVSPPVFTPYRQPGATTTPPTNLSIPPYTPPALPGANPADPANLQPTLSYSPNSSSNSSGLRSQLRAITQQPVPTTHPLEPALDSPRFNEPARLTNEPSARPIPVPEGFDSPKPWSPGLLREQDMTAQNRQIHAEARARAYQVAGQSKQIHWASFDSRRPKVPNLQLEQPRQTQRPAVAAQPAPGPRMVPIAPPSFPVDSLRQIRRQPLASSPAMTPIQQPSLRVRQSNQTPNNIRPATSGNSNGGWMPSSRR